MAAKRLIPQTPSEEAYAAEADQGEVFTNEDPVALFGEWLALAGKKEPNDPNAMALATVDAEGLPDVRMVLLKELDATGLTFFTNTDSAKGLQIGANPNAAVCFHWKTIRRQARFRGPVENVSEAEADAYFKTRARTAKIGAWASAQSRTLEGRFVLEKEVARTAARFGLGDVPRPPHWSGYRLVPRQIEFWVSRPFRLHDRLLFERRAPNAPWTTRRLWP